MTVDPLARLRAADPLGGEPPAALPGPPALPTPERSVGRGTPPLTFATAVLFIAVTVHGVDHAFVQDRGLGPLGWHVLAGGASMFATSLVSLLAAIAGDRLARPIAIAAGAWIALLAFAGHFLPADTRSALDPYAGLGLDTFSWVAAGAVVLAGVLVVAAAARAPASHWCPPRRRF